MFNGINTPFDQHGWASLKSYDGNRDGPIDALVPLYKLDYAVGSEKSATGYGSNNSLRSLSLGQTPISCAKSLRRVARGHGQQAKRCRRVFSASPDAKPLAMKTISGPASNPGA